jgi:hypothetical protein
MREWTHSSIVLNLVSTWRFVVSFTTLPLYPWGQSPQFQVYIRLDEPPSLYGEETNLLTLPGIEPRLVGPPARSPVTTPAALSWLPYIVGSKYFQICMKYPNI